MLKPLPPVPEELVKRLDSQYPERCPDQSMTDREIWFYAGQREMVKTIKRWYEQNLNVHLQSQHPQTTASTSHPASPTRS